MNKRLEILDLLNEKESLSIPYVQRKLKLKTSEIQEAFLWLVTCCDNVSCEKKEDDRIFKVFLSIH